MAKKYKGDDISIEPPQEGWGILWFSDGYKAQVSGAKPVTYKGQEFLRFYVMPFDALAKRFDIDMKKDLNDKLHTYKYIPKNAVKNLNPYDPSRRIFLSMYNWNNERTPATSWMEGSEQSEEIEKLRHTIRKLRAENEKLKEENMMMKTNTMQYVQENFEGLLRPLSPMIREMLIGASEAQQNAQ